MACAASMSIRTSTSTSSATTVAFTVTSLSKQCLGLATHHMPTSYRDITTRTNPRKGTGTPRRMTRRRKTATGMRQDGRGKTKTVNQNHPSVAGEPPDGEPPDMGGPGTTG